MARKPNPTVGAKAPTFTHEKRPTSLLDVSSGLQPPADPRCVAYARTATETPHRNSIERQLDACSKYAHQIGANLVAPIDQFVDRAKSGVSLAGRTGLDDLLACAAKGAFDMVVVEDADRISRDLGQLTEIHETLRGLDVDVHTVMRGELSLADLALTDCLAAEQRRRIAALSRRGKAAAKARATAVNAVAKKA